MKRLYWRVLNFIDSIVSDVLYFHKCSNCGKGLDYEPFIEGTIYKKEDKSRCFEVEVKCPRCSRLNKYNVLG